MTGLDDLRRDNDDNLMYECYVQGRKFYVSQFYLGIETCIGIAAWCVAWCVLIRFSCFVPTSPTPTMTNYLVWYAC